MRQAFFEALTEAAARDPRIMLLTGDLGFGAVTPFSSRHPERFINVGVAEQNMTGLATGLALAGRVVFTYSIANFPTLRCLEQIRNGPCYHGLNVKIVAVGGGLAYGALGATHHATEDLAIMRALPGMTVVAPGDARETSHAVEALCGHEGPAYLRLSRSGASGLPSGPFALGRARMLRQGADVTFISTGSMLDTAMAVATSLSEEGTECRVLSMHTIVPLDTDAILDAARDTPLIVTLEEHSIVGGLGSAVAETLVDAGARATLRRLALPSAFISVGGSRDYLCDRYGLSPQAVLKSVKQSLNDEQKPLRRR